MVRIVVVGAGIAGLTTAVNIQKTMPEVKVTIIADKFDLDTTSSGAAGVMLLPAKGKPGIPYHVTKEWIRAAWDYFSSLAMSPLSQETGHTLVPGFVVSNKPDQIMDPIYADIVFNYRILSEEELKRMKLPFKYGSTFITVVSQPQKFMPWLMKKFQQRGGRVERRKLQSLEELAGSYDIVVNCAGLGSQQLLQDTNMYPVRGQLVHIKAPWVKTFIYCDSEKPTYFIPHNDYVIVGGTREVGDYSTDVSQHTQQDILTRAAEIFPQVKGAEVVGSWAGLRPHRDPLRLEKQLLTVNGKSLRVVHNYGHGANGITLSWGTSLQAARLVKEWANEISLSSKL